MEHTVLKQTPKGTYILSDDKTNSTVRMFTVEGA